MSDTSKSKRAKREEPDIYDALDAMRWRALLPRILEFKIRAPWGSSTLSATNPDGEGDMAGLLTECADKQIQADINAEVEMARRAASPEGSHG